jgi:type 1 fimbriae regulatory protein FimE
MANLMKMSALSPSEVLGVLRAAKQQSVRDWCLLLLCYRHGMRVSEVCQLTVDDIDTRSWHVSIRRLKGSRHTIQAIEAHRGEPLLNEQRALKEWLAVRPTDCGSALFTSKKGGHLSRSQAFRIFQALAREIGLPQHRQHIHCLKHSVATHLVRGDMNLAKVQMALGHASITSSMKYVTVTDRETDVARANTLMNVNWRAVGIGAGQ